MSEPLPHGYGLGSPARPEVCHSARIEAFGRGSARGLGRIRAVPGVHPIDYKRASAVGRRIIEVGVPAKLVARKGTSQLARRRCREAQDGLRESIAREFAGSHRRPYRGEVAVHLELAGIDDLTTPRSHRTVKALVDAMQGPVFADD